MSRWRRKSDKKKKKERKRKELDPNACLVLTAEDSVAHPVSLINREGKGS